MTTGHVALNFHTGQHSPAMDEHDYYASTLNKAAREINKGKWNARSRQDVVKLAHRLTPGSRKTTCAGLFKALDERQKDYQTKKPLKYAMELIKILVIHVIIQEKVPESINMTLNADALDTAKRLCEIVQGVQDVQNRPGPKGRAPELIQDVTFLKQMANRCRYTKAIDFLISKIDVQPNETWDSCILSLPSLVSENVKGLGIKWVVM